MEASHVELEAQAIEEIARRVAQLLGAAGRSWDLLDANGLAERLGVERDWVYEHADELGAIRLGGEHGRLRFDLEEVKEILRARNAPPARSGRRRPARRASKPGTEAVKSSLESDGPARQRRLRRTTDRNKGS
jgi:hypothetical protein